MEIITKIEGKTNTPTVLFHIEEGSLVISGRSFPEHPVFFYDKILETLNKFKKDHLKITMSFDYVNTSSSKCLLELLKYVQQHFKKISVIWVSEEEDEDIEELGQDFESFLNIPFKFIVKV